MKLCSQKKCTGCEACFNVCPLGCIEMVGDVEGFSYPKIDQRLCTGCGFCEAVCPMLNEPLLNREEKPRSYAAWNNDKIIRKESSSGGMFSVFADHTLENGGYVYGAAFDEDFVLHHRCVQTKKELVALRGSKYIQSRMYLAFKNLKEKLDDDKQVLFSGTPCQIAGLYNYLGKDYGNLVTLDLVCFGVSSPSIFKQYVEWQGKKYVSKPKELLFRDKEFGWKNFSVKIIFEDEAVYRKRFSDDPFARGFSGAFYIRPSCHICSFSSIPRVGDLSLGDFWGIGETRPFSHDTQNGVSLVLINSCKGEHMFNACQERFFAVKRDLEEAVSGNPHLSCPTEPNILRKDFFATLVEKGFEKALNRYLLLDTTKRIRRGIAKLIGPRGVLFIKKIKNK